MRILFITRDKYPPHRPAAAAIFNVELAKRGHVIDWVMQAAAAQSASTRPYGNGTAYIGANSGTRTIAHRVFSRLQDLLHYFRVFRLLKAGAYDVVQVKDHYTPAFVTLLACRLRNVPFCYWLAYPHAEGSLYKSREGITRFRWYYLVRGHYWKWMLYKVLLPSAAHVFVQSEQMKLDVAGEGIAAEQMTAVPGSIDLANVPYDRTATATYGDTGMGDADIVYLGTLSRVRHLDFLIRVFAIVADSNSEAKLFMLGKGDEPEDRPFLENEAERLGVADRVVFTGHLPMQRAWEYIRESAVCVSPYFPTMILNSTSPTKLIEYMAMAKPVVGNDHPEQRLVIDSSGAGICVPYEESAFAEAIVHLVENPETARKMGLRGRDYVETHRTNAVMADVVEKEYRRICNSRTAMNAGQ